MTDNNHSITPPTDLVIDWRLDPGYIECTEKVTMVTMTTGRLQYIATQAARWGADMELEACVQWIKDNCYSISVTDHLRAARRSKPPGLKELALKALKNIDDACESEGFSRSDDTDIIRRALEQLND